MYWLQRSRKRGEEEDNEEEDEELEKMDYISSSPTSEQQPKLWEADIHVGT